MSSLTKRELTFPVCQCSGIVANVVADALEGGGAGDDAIIEIVEPEGAEPLDAHGIAGMDPGNRREGFVGTDNTAEGRRRLALAREPENAMDVVGHNYEGIQLHAWELLGQRLPGLVKDGMQLGMLKNRVVRPGVDRHKIRSGLRIIIALEALGFSTIGVPFPWLMLLWSHPSLSFPCSDVLPS